MINIPGQLAIRTINGRNGEFNVGKLSTSIGEFVIKDALLDQHIEGKYRGDFAITEIRPSYYTTGGRLVVEIRAKLDSMTLDDVDNLSDEEAERLSGNEVDPLDERVHRLATHEAAPPFGRHARALLAIGLVGLFLALPEGAALLQELLVRLLGHLQPVLDRCGLPASCGQGRLQLGHVALGATSRGVHPARFRGVWGPLAAPIVKAFRTAEDVGHDLNP